MRALPLLLLLLLAFPLHAAEDAARYRQCLATAGRAPEVAINAAQAWLVENGGAPAFHCLGMAHMTQGNPKQASDSFARAAQKAQEQNMPQAAALWAQAGNAALLANDTANARSHFDKALALPENNAVERSNILIDRARTLHALGDNQAAALDLDAALVRTPEDVTALLLRASLARQMGDKLLAQKHIAHAQKLDPKNADVAAEAAGINAQK